MGLVQSGPPSIRASLFCQTGKLYNPLGQEIKIDLNKPVPRFFIIIDNPPPYPIDVTIITDSTTTKNEMKVTRKSENKYDENYDVIEIPRDMIVERPLLKHTKISISAKIVYGKTVINQWFSADFENVGETPRYE